MNASSSLAERTFTADALSVRVYRSQADLAKAAAGDAHAYLREVIRRQGEARVILASAASQVQFLAALTKLPALDWSVISVFHMDEYLGVTERHPASFRHFLREHVFGQVAPKIFHAIQGEALEPIVECERYTRLLASAPIDLCCLGIGENGHIAFNDPPVANFSDPGSVKLVKLDEACRQQQVGEGAFPTLAAVPEYAFTLTIPRLCSAAKLLCIVPEQRKARAVRDALEGPIAHPCPASVLRRQPHATLYLDADSASLLHP